MSIVRDNVFLHRALPLQILQVSQGILVKKNDFHGNSSYIVYNNTPKKTAFSNHWMLQRVHYITVLYKKKYNFGLINSAQTVQCQLIQ